jgi:hypothetical protein
MLGSDDDDEDDDGDDGVVGNGSVGFGVCSADDPFFDGSVGPRIVNGERSLSKLSGSSLGRCSLSCKSKNSAVELDSLSLGALYRPLPLLDSETCTSSCGGLRFVGRSLTVPNTTSGPMNRLSSTNGVCSSSM